MAEINIQKKKSRPGPWLLILLLLVVIGLIGYFVLRTTPETEGPVGPPAPTDGQGYPNAAPDTTSLPPAAADSSAAPGAAFEGPVTPAALMAFARRETNRPDYARQGLRMLRTTLVDLADRDDLRDATISEKRDELTSATNRLDEANTSLRPGFVAAAALLQAIQQKTYPDLENAANELSQQAAQLTGRATAADQPGVQAFLLNAAKLVRAIVELTV